MNDAILLALAQRWKQDAEVPKTQVAIDASNTQAVINKAVEQGQRECKRECADAIETLVGMLGEK